MHLRQTVRSTVALSTEKDGAKVRNAQEKALRWCTCPAKCTQLLLTFKTTTWNSFPTSYSSTILILKGKRVCQILHIGWIKEVAVKQLNGFSANCWKTRVSGTHRLCRARYELHSTFVSTFDEFQLQLKNKSILILCVCVKHCCCGQRMCIPINLYKLKPDSLLPIWNFTFQGPEYPWDKFRKKRPHFAGLMLPLNALDWCSKSEMGRSNGDLPQAGDIKILRLPILENQYRSLFEIPTLILFRPR